MSNGVNVNFTSWLNSTLDLQRTAFDIDPPYLEGDERTEYVRWNTLAAIDELMEALHEISWKPWQTADYFNREAFVGELIDVMHFIGNMLVTAGVTGEELSQRYHSKQQRNRYRQEVGYDGVEGKCPTCRRSFDDILEHDHTHMFFTMDGIKYCGLTCAHAGADC
jgi:hypothetical protein